MKQRHMTIAAISCGALCALCVGAFLWNVQGEANAARAEVLARYGGEQVEACVALRDIAAGERVDASAVESRLWVADLLPDGALGNTGDAVGKTATSAILKGEVVSSKRFEQSQGALDIPQGLEAVSVPAKAVQAVGGAIRPGMSVDVYASGSSGTAPLARNVIVLATSMGEAASLVSGDSGWITLAVSPEKVEEIIAASNKASLHFALPGEKPAESASSASPAAADASSQAAAKPGSGQAAAGHKSGPAANTQDSGQPSPPQAGDAAETQQDDGDEAQAPEEDAPADPEADE